MKRIPIPIESFSQFPTYFNDLESVERGGVIRVCQGKNLLLNEKQTVFVVEVPYNSNEIQEKVYSSLKQFLLLPNVCGQIVRFQNVFVSVSLLEEIECETHHSRTYYLSTNLPYEPIRNLDNISAKELMDLFMEAVYGLYILKEYGFVHNNITPSSVFLSKNGRFKFGCPGLGFRYIVRQFIDDDDRWHYLAPELRNEGFFTHQGDVYSLGMVFKSLIKVKKKKTSREDKVRGKFLGTSCKKVVEMILLMTLTDPVERPCIDDIVKKLLVEFPKKMRKIIDVSEEKYPRSNIKFNSSQLPDSYDDTSRVSISGLSEVIEIVPQRKSSVFEDLELLEPKPGRRRKKKKKKLRNAPEEEIQIIEEPNPSEEIENSSGNDSALQQEQQQQQPMQVDLGGTKIVLLGGTAVGKSSILVRYVRDEFHEHYSSTIGAAYLSKKVGFENYTLTLNMWDTAGQEKYDSLCSLYYRDADLALVVYDITDRSSFIKAKSWYKELKMADSTQRTVVYFVGNKIDMVNARKSVSEEEVSEWCDEHGAIPLHLTSAKSKEGITGLFSDVVKDLVKKKLDDMRSEERETASPFSFTLRNEPPPQRRNCFTMLFFPKKLRKVVDINEDINFHTEIENIKKYGSKCFSRRKYKVDGKVLGIGSQSLVYLVEKKYGHESLAIEESEEDHEGGAGKFFAMKRYKPEYHNEATYESVALQMFNHPNIIQLIDTFEVENYYGQRIKILITEFCESESLKKIVTLAKEKSARLESTESKFSFLLDLVVGLQEIHEKRFIHHDINSSNVFVQKGRLKWGDFGSCVYLERKEKRRNVPTQSQFVLTRSPEMKKGNFRKIESDIYLLGLLMIEVFIHEVVDVTVLDDLLGRIVTIQGTVALLRKCLEKSPKKRPGIDELLKELSMIFDGFREQRDEIVSNAITESKK